MDMTLGNLKVVLSAATTGFQKSMEQATSTMSAFQAEAAGVSASLSQIGMTFSVIGAGLSAGIMAATKAYASMGSTLSDVADRTGVSVEALSEMEYVLSAAGIGLNDFEISMKRMQMMMFAVSSSSGGNINKIVKELGINLQDLKKMAPEDQFMEVSKGIAQIQDPSKMASMALQIFGRSGTRLLPILKQGEGAMAALRKEARAFGYTMTLEAAVAADTLDDSLAQMWISVKLFTFELGAALAPRIQWFADTLKSLTGTIRSFIRENENLTKTIYWLGIGLGAFGAILLAVGSIMGTVLGVMKLLTFVTVAGNKAILLSFAKWLIPLTLIAVAIAFVTDLLLQLFGVGNLGLIDLVNNFRIAGLSIGTWFEISFLRLMQAWDWVTGNIGLGIKWVMNEVKAMALGIISTVMDMAAKVASAFRMEGTAKWFKNVAKEARNALAEGDNAFAAEAEALEKDLALYDKAIDRVIAADLAAKGKETPEGKKGKAPDDGSMNPGEKQTSFAVMNLARMSLATPAGIDTTSSQAVKAVGVESRLDITNTLLSRMTTGLGLG